MPGISLRPQFQRALRKFTKKNSKHAQVVKESLRRFQEDPNYPSLHLEKLSGSDTWTIRIDKGNWLFFIWSTEGDIAIFFYVGPHDAYKKLK